MSEREAVQQKIVAHLYEHRKVWNAPYGILDGLHEVKRGGKVRTVTFGCARTLDAIAFIWTPTRIEVQASGPLSPYVMGDFKSVDEFIAHIAELEGKA